MSVGRFFLFSFAQNLNRSTSAHFHITVCVYKKWRIKTPKLSASTKLN